MLLGTAFVIGPILVPSPAMGMIALLMIRWLVVIGLAPDVVQVILPARIIAVKHQKKVIKKVIGLRS
jgi:hypothetical protein